MISCNLEEKLLKSKELSLTNPRKSYELAKKVFLISKNNNLKLKADSLLHMAYACRVMSDYPSCFNLAYKALDIYIEINDQKGILGTKNIIGITYFYFGSFSESIENFLSALEIINFYPDPNLESSILNNIGEIYREASNKEKSLEYYTRALELTKNNKLYRNTLVIYSNIADLYIKNEKMNLAYDYLKKAKELLTRTNDLISQAEIERRLGRVLFELGDESSSNSYFLSSLYKLNKIENKFYLVDLLIEMGICEEKKGANPVKHLLEALGYTIDFQLHSKASRIYSLLSNYYESTFEYNKALHYFKSYHNKEKEIETINLSKRLEIISIEFNYYKEKKESIKFKALTNKLQQEITNVNDELNNIKRLNVSLEKETIIDELTQLYNRRGIEKMFSLREPSENQTNYSVIMVIDIDNFKLYNDYWGHLQGDICLTTISHALKQFSSRNIFAGRYGGEEFLCFSSIKNMDEGFNLAEEIRFTIQKLKIPYTTSIDSLMVTVSVGISTGNIDKNNYKEYFLLADQALYRAKNSGRNCVKN